MRFDPLLLALLALVAVAVLPIAATAQPAVPPPAKPGLALTVFPAKSGKTLAVTSPAFQQDGDIPFENTQYRGNVFPGLAWGKGPYGTRTFVVIMQDADANYRGGPLLHWSMYDIPGGVMKLPAGMTAPPAGASFGPNVRGPNHAYMGPHTPPGPKHHYHFQVFALDEDIAADPALSYDALAAAMTGHVLASGELVGLGQADPNAPPRAPAAPAPAAASPAKP
ncbi:MAG TPA: YbhB/YbcL family Raf kinase inhibitor-like protein [Caulobacteraceae bacterium]|nr:YbhB/YbcL family Raf kinase inhibitor-like protein [Caulobacteraceae bacterium]